MYYVYSLISMSLYVQTHTRIPLPYVHRKRAGDKKGGGRGRGGGVYSPRKYLHLYAIIFPACPVHGIMLSGETRLSRILKGFNNIWKLLPKSWRSSSSLRYVLGATLGIRPIHLLFSSASSPFPSSPSSFTPHITKVSGVCGHQGERGRGPSLLLHLSPPSPVSSYRVHKLSLGGYDDACSGDFNFSA